MIICNIKKSRMYDILYLDFHNVYVIFFLLLSVYYAHDNEVSKIHINISSTDAFFGVSTIYMFEFFFFIFQESSSMADRKEGSVSYSEGRQNHTERVTTSKNAKNVIYSRMNGSVGKDVQSSGNQSTR